MRLSATLSGLALVCVTALSAAYISFGVLDADPFGESNGIELSIPTRNQLQVGTPVNLHGIRIGSVKSVVRTDSTAKVKLEVATKYGIPIDSPVKIEQLSAVGEPYINFVPPVLRAPFLPANAKIAAERISTPPETVDIFKRIASLTNAIESSDVAGLLNSLRLATSGAPRALQQLGQAGTLFEQVIVSRLPQIRSMLASSQHYQADMVWLPGAISGSATALTDVFIEGKSYLEAIDKVVRDAGTPGINRDIITPFVQQIAPDTTRLIASLGPLAGPLTPVLAAATANTPPVDLAGLLAGAARAFDSEGSLRIHLTPGQP